MHDLHSRYRYWLIGLVVSALIGAALTAHASVTLLYFTAAPLTDAIEVKWETATELNTIGFSVYRSTTENPASWGSPVFTTASRSLDGTTGAKYAYVDGVDGNVGNVQPGVRYYYLLEELSSGGNTLFTGKVAAAGIGLPAGQATASPTAVASPTPTRANTPTTSSDAADAPAPTATRQFPNTETPIPTATLTPFTDSAFDSTPPTPFQAPTATPLTSFQLSSPTPVGGVPPQQEPPATPEPATSTPIVLVEPTEPTEPTATPTSLTAQLEQGPSPTPLLQAQSAGATRTPQVFEPSGAARPAAPGPTAAARNSRLAFMLGGGAVALAVLLGIGGIVFWRRR